MRDDNKFIQIDGIDGSGKSTLLAAARAWAEGRNLKIFDVVDWSEREKTLPRLEDVGVADVLLAAEPTHAGIGWAIRNEIIRNDTPYDAAFASHAFALDRGVQYRRLILPFLAARPGCWVIQDRGLLSSLAYQPLQYETEKREPGTGNGEPVTIEWLLTLPGNKIALERVPDVFVFLDVDPKLARDRLAGRSDKKDDVRYEHTKFQTALAERFKRPDVTAPYTSRGTRMMVIDGGKTKVDVAVDMTRLLDELSS
ncbi:hypothetical protein A3D73_02875 [Candidatus Uhrbacteria bacterium RIFCSPHIGHO2_02_FULL_60_44]|nr:MAG: hypothetical protein A3D73_02875 [Candidatus Uhrbacteria bacterium RIFCSPHIGHO2_02_FULL_60_44]